MFKFRLTSVLKYREHIREQRRAMLAAVLAELAQLDARREATETRRTLQLDELRDIVAAGTVDIDAAAARRFHSSLLTYDLLKLAHERRLIEQQVAAVRAALVTADQAVKALEKLADRQRAEWDARQIQKADREREESWQAAHMGDPWS
jgi:flagellar export protein FliJ